MTAFVPVLKVEELPPGSMRTVHVDGRPVLVANVDGTFHAIGAVCTHEEADLGDGDIEGDTVVCSLHFARFSLITGEVLDGPAEIPEPVYSVRVEDGQVWVGPPAAGE